MQIQDVQQSFQTGEETVQVLKDVSFDIEDNTFNIVFGASGSGKSTLLNVLTGLQKPTSGKVLFGGKDVYGFTPDELARFRAHRIGIVYQQNYWVQSLSVLENVALPLYFLGYERSLAADMALISLERVGMTDYAKRNPTLLSGGEQQRVGMARALVNDPMVVIADEPTGNLDSENGDMIMELLSKSCTEARRTIILVTHNLEYLPLADHLLHIQDGALQSLGNSNAAETAAELLRDLKRRMGVMTKHKEGATRNAAHY